MKDTHVAQLTTLISTRSRLNRFLQQMKEVERALFNKKNDSEKLFASYFTVSEANLLSQIASSSGINIADPRAFSAFLKEISGCVRNVPVVTLHLAFEPTLLQLSEFSQWFVEAFGFPVILDLYYNAELIGGVIVEYGGKRHDFSLRKKILKLNYYG